MDFLVLIMGSDANAYYMARCCYEAYHKKAYLIGKSPMPYTSNSSILNIEYDENIWNEEGFLNALNRFKEQHKNNKILLISSNETYVEFISRNKDKIDKCFYYNYPDIKIVESLINKENFYKTYSDSILDFPKTLYYDCSLKEKLNVDFKFPIIIKPSNVVEYNHLKFEGKNKIYKVENKKDLKDIVNRIVESGYKDTLIIQEFIPGDDSYLFDSVVYVDHNHKVKLISMAQIGLQEHTKSMVGNAAVLINGYNQHGDIHAMEDVIKKFMEDIGYQGFAEFDLKYDSRDKKYKVLEINARQGRSSYYISKSGYNLVKVLADDLIYNKKTEYKFIDKKILLSFVPKGVIKKYIKNDEYRKYALKLWNKDVVNPLDYKKDKNIKRKIFLLKRHFIYFKEYKNSYWKAD